MTPPPRDGSVWIVLPAHNRRPVTLHCLEHLRATGVLAWARVIVVDDGSRDGTAEAVRAEFPAVTVLAGDGNLYWTGAIVRGMRHALDRGGTCCVWLNDDSHPVAGAVERVVAHALASGGICAGLGRFVGRHEAITFYALHRACWGLRVAVIDPAAEALIPVDACRGNLVAIPRAVTETIGYPDAENLPQYFADTDYTLRATAAGFPCVIDPQAVVEEQEVSGNLDESWRTTTRPMREIWRRFALRQASLYWRANWVYLRRHWGWWRGGMLFAAPYVRLTAITLWRTLGRGRLTGGRGQKSR